MGSLVRTTSLAMVFALVGAASGRAQEAVSLFVHGGGYSALKDLNNDGTAEFKLGFTLGGGIGLHIDQNLELRGTLTGAQSHFRNAGAETGVYLNRYYLVWDLKAQYPIPRGVTPYGIIGVGAVLLHEKGASGENKVQGVGHLGLGIARAIRQNLSFFVQGDGFFYSLSELTGGALSPFTRVQTDVAWSAGVSYRFPF